MRAVVGRLPSLSRLVLEETTLLASLVKWTVLAGGVGLLVGVSTAAFLWVLGVVSREIARLPLSLLLLPLGFLVASVLVRWLAPEAAGHGTEKVIEAVHRRWGRIAAAVAPVKLTATVITIGVGGSVGKEGPCAQIGAALASSVASLLRLRPRDRRKIVICGISAGFATVFGTPIAGSIFGIEVLFLGSLLYDVLYPSFVAGFVGYEVGSGLGIRYFHQALIGLPHLTAGLLVRTMVSGVAFGVVALLMIEVLRRLDGLVRRLPWAPPVKALSGGGLLAVLVTLVGTRYLGLGVESIEASVRGTPMPPLAFAWKILFTAVSLGVGGSGGIVTPIFFVGATAGNTVGDLLGLDRGMFSAIGMVAMLAAAANTPVSSAIMAIELFGADVAPFAAIASAVAFVMVGHRSVYPSQVLAIAKTPSVRVPRGQALEAVSEVLVRPSGLRRLRVRWRALQRRRRPPLGDAPD